MCVYARELVCARVCFVNVLTGSDSLIYTIKDKAVGNKNRIINTFLVVCVLSMDM